MTVVDNHSMAAPDDDRIKRQKLRQKFQNSTLEQLATEADQRVIILKLGKVKLFLV